MLASAEALLAERRLARPPVREAGLESGPVQGTWASAARTTTIFCRKASHVLAHAHWRSPTLWSLASRLPGRRKERSLIPLLQLRNHLASPNPSTWEMHQAVSRLVPRVLKRQP